MVNNPISMETTEIVEDNALPIDSVCPICKKEFVNPVMSSLCEHYFCYNCFQQSCNETCFVCKKSTMGMFDQREESISEMVSRVLEMVSVAGQRNEEATKLINAAKEMAEKVVSVAVSSMKLSIKAAEMVNKGVEQVVLATENAKKVKVIVEQAEFKMSVSNANVDCSMDQIKKLLGDLNKPKH